MVYIFVICLPGLGVVYGQTNFFLPKYASFNGMAVSGNMHRKKFNRWDTEADYGSSKVSCQNSGGKDVKNLKRKITVEDNFGKTAITFSIDEETECCTAFGNFFEYFTCSPSDSADVGANTHWTVQAQIGKKSRGWEECS